VFHHFDGYMVHLNNPYSADSVHRTAVSRICFDILRGHMALLSGREQQQASYSQAGDTHEADKQSLCGCFIMLCNHNSRLCAFRHTRLGSFVIGVWDDIFCRIAPFGKSVEIQIREVSAQG
jgi:hypothetical protein